MNEIIQKPDEAEGALPLSSLALPTSGFIVICTHHMSKKQHKGWWWCRGFDNCVCATATLVHQTFKLHPTQPKHKYTHTHKQAKVETRPEATSLSSVFSHIIELAMMFRYRMRL